jgi:hypothetical protein
VILVNSVDPGAKLIAAFPAPGLGGCGYGVDEFASQPVRRRIVRFGDSDWAAVMSG